jgi:hypothetical protein
VAQNTKKMKKYFINQEIYDEILFLLENYTDNFMPPTDYINMIRYKMSIQVSEIVFFDHTFLTY